MLDFKKQVAHIGGWLTIGECKFLYQNARGLHKEGKIIEIGSWKGRSTICLGKGVKDGNGATIYAIDPHKGSSEHKKRFGKVNTYKEFLLNIQTAGVDKFVVPIKATSENAYASSQIDKPIDFVLVDGDHEYKYVKKDYELWFPKLKNKGVIAFHDCWHTIGVHYLTATILLTSNKVKNPNLIDTLTIMEKIEQNNLFDRLYNFVFVIYRLIFGWIGTLKMDYSGTVLNETKKTD